MNTPLNFEVMKHQELSLSVFCVYIAILIGYSINVIVNSTNISLVAITWHTYTPIYSSPMLTHVIELCGVLCG